MGVHMLETDVFEFKFFNVCISATRLHILLKLSHPGISLTHSMFRIHTEAPEFSLSVYNQILMKFLY